MFWNTFINQSILELGTPYNSPLCSSSSSSFLFWVSVSASPCDEFPRTSFLMLSLLADAGCSVGVTVSCDEDAGDVGEDELEELFDRPKTTKGTCSSLCRNEFSCHFLMRCGF